MTKRLNQKIIFSVEKLRYASILTILAIGFALLPVYTADAQVLSRYLSIGMSGPDVTALQTFLASDRTLYPQGLVTGYFGPLTQAAVMNFQRRNGISPVGRVGPVTLPVISAQMTGGVGALGSAPLISNANVSTGQNNATLRWNTNEGASSVVYFSNQYPNMTEGSATADVAISGTPVIAHTDLRTTHEANIGNLQRNSLYYYVIYTRDGVGNVTVTWPAMFRTSL